MIWASPNNKKLINIISSKGTAQVFLKMYIISIAINCTHLALWACFPGSIKFILFQMPFTTKACSKGNRGKLGEVFVSKSVLGTMAYAVKESFKSSIIPVRLSESWPHSWREVNQL